MALNDLPPVLSSVASAARRSWFLRIFCIGVLILLLLIPLAMTSGVLRERQSYRAKVVDEIAAVWGREQRVLGPVLAVPYVYRGTTVRQKSVNGVTRDVAEPVEYLATAYFLPPELSVDSSVDPEIRRRGIYDAVVYTSHLTFKGKLRPDFAAAGIEAERVLWQKARVLFGVSDLHGLRSLSTLSLSADKEVPFDAVDPVTHGILALGAETGVLTNGVDVPFSFTAVVQGSGSVNVAPVGKTTVLAMKSSWADPSFVGAWLPNERQVSGEGFAARWSVAHFSRGFPQAWTSKDTALTDMIPNIDKAAVGVRFAARIDGYAMVERAQKYGILFLTLTFAVFFLFEVTAGLRIHPLQYAMVGAALCLFFLGFLALTELWPTALAYAVSAAACTGMITLYALTFLRTGVRTLVIGGGLAATYGCLYFVLQSQDYALIAGTAVLFAALAAAMFFTRRVDWYGTEQAPGRA